MVNKVQWTYTDTVSGYVIETGEVGSLKVMD